MRTTSRIRMALALGALALLPRVAGAQAGAAAPASTRVSYLAGASVYIEAGRLQGIAEGDTLVVLRGDRVVSRLVAKFVSASRASCDTLAAPAMPQVGDVVRFRPGVVAELTGAATGATAATVVAADSARPGTTPPARPSPQRLRGRIGARLLLVSPDGLDGYTQPALDLRLDGTSLGGKPVDLLVDVRGHHTYYSGGGQPDYSTTRVYRLAASVHDAAARTRLTVGRQFSPSLAVVSLFDGALASYSKERWGAGAFAGAEPEPTDYGFSSDLIDAGGFVELRSRALAEQRWTLSTGFVASWDQGNASRDYFFVQGFWTNQRLWASLAQQIDINASWKQDLGDPAIGLTSTFATARYQATPELDVRAGYDNRRDARLYRDRETPETEFDDRHRQGAWAGASYMLDRRFRFGADGRWSGGGTAGDYKSLTATAEALRLTSLQFTLRARGTRTLGDDIEGWLFSGGLALRPYGDLTLDLAGGVRITEEVFSGIESRVTWESIGLDLPLARRWFLLLSVEHSQGTSFDEIQSYTSASYVF